VLTPTWHKVTVSIPVWVKVSIPVWDKIKVSILVWVKVKVMDTIQVWDMAHLVSIPIWDQVRVSIPVWAMARRDSSTTTTQAWTCPIPAWAPTLVCQVQACRNLLPACTPTCHTTAACLAPV
jgi:hypothetical protein